MATNIKHSGDVTLGVLMHYLAKQSSVVFPNGCFVSFEVSEGLCGGDTPYGQETLFDLGDTKKLDNKKIGQPNVYHCLCAAWHNRLF